MFNLTTVTNSIGKVGRQFAGEFRKNSPTILSATAIVCFVGSTVALWKGKDRIESDFKKKDDDILSIKTTNEEERRAEIKRANIECAKNVTVHALPFAVLSTATILSIIGAQKINNKRIAALSAAYTIAERNLDDWKKKVEELYGKSKAEKVQDEVNKDHLSKQFGNENVQYEIQNTGCGTELIFDAYSGQLFWSDINRIRTAVNDFNSDMLEEAAAHLISRYGVEEYYEKDMSDLYFYLGIKQPESAAFRRWRNDRLMDVSWTVTEMNINGENRTVKIITFLNDFTPQWRDNLL